MREIGGGGNRFFFSPELFFPCVIVFVFLFSYFYFLCFGFVLVDGCITPFSYVFPRFAFKLFFPINPGDVIRCSAK